MMRSFLGKAVKETCIKDERERMPVLSILRTSGTTKTESVSGCLRRGKTLASELGSQSVEAPQDGTGDESQADQVHRSKMRSFS